MLPRREHPVAPLRQPVAVHAHGLSRPHLVHAGIDRAFWILREHEDFAKSVLVHARLHSGVRKHRFRLVAEQHAIRGRVVKERLHAHTVKNQKQLFRSNVPEREGEHAVETFGNLVAPLQVSAEHDFSVAAGLELVTELPQLVTQLYEVVDLAGVDEGDGRPPLFLYLHRLHATSEVDDSKTAMAEADMPIDPDTARIRTA